MIHWPSSLPIWQVSLSEKMLFGHLGLKNTGIWAGRLSFPEWFGSCFSKYPTAPEKPPETAVGILLALSDGKRPLV
jgi:hypothetical protein